MAQIKIFKLICEIYRKCNIMNLNKNEKDTRTHEIIGAAMEVHNHMGPGLLEAVYQECLEIEFELRNILFLSKPKLDLYYKNKKLNKFYIPDFICFNEIIIEIKAEKQLCKADEAQILKVDRKWVVFRYKDYAQGAKVSTKIMRLFTFITYLIQHIPDKYFRNCRGYGLFSNRLKGKLLPLVIKKLRKKQKRVERVSIC